MSRCEPCPIVNDLLRAQVAQYVRDCRTHREVLNPRYHPTENGAIKVVFAHNSDEKDQIRAEFRRIMAEK